MKKRVLLIGWDAADWKVLSPLLDAGQMPALRSLVERGTIGNIATLQPPLSPMLWTSIVTGKRAYKHGICGFVEPDPSDPSGLRAVSSTSRSTKAIWNIAQQAGYHSSAVGFFASHPAEPLNGVCVSNQFWSPGSVNFDAHDWPMPDDSVHPARLREPIRQLRVHPSEISAADLTPFIPSLQNIEPGDPRPRKIAEVLAKTASIQAVTTAILENEPWEFLAVYFDAIDVISHHFMPFHPPRMPNGSQTDFVRYAHVVSAIYRFHDMMLARQLELAGSDATVVVVSDHGFHSDHLRPVVSSDAAEAELDAAWHRPLGMLCIAGPGIRADERVYGANLLDVTPTLLTLMGLPVGQDMDGKVLGTALVDPPEVRRIESWDSAEGEAGTHAPGTTPKPFEQAQALQQLVDLGYLDPLTESSQSNIDRAVTEAAFNRSVSQLDAGRVGEAVGTLVSLHRSDPHSARFSTVLAQCYQRLGRSAEAVALLEALVANDSAVADADLLLAAARFNGGQQELGLQMLRAAAMRRPNDPKAQLLLGSAELQLQHWQKAETAFRACLDVDDANHEALDGLALSLLRQHRPEEAADYALKAVGVLHHFPLAHMHLGMALAAMGEHERALRPLGLAVTMQPRLLEAHRFLASIYRERGDRELAAKHRAAAESLVEHKPDPK